MAQIYQPSDDSLFFAEFLKNYLQDLEGEIDYLDMGTGSGILSETVSEFIPKENILAADINLDAVELVKSKGFKCIESNLFSNIPNTFDIITFNAPYLPKDDKEPEDSALATTGGIKGDEISVEFLKQAKKHLNPLGRIFLLVSSLTPLDKIKEFNPKEVSRKKIFMEELIIFEFQ